MKKARIVLSVFMIVLIAFAWLSLAKRSISNVKDYQAYITGAETNVAQSLYQKAIEDYEKALDIKESENVRRDLLRIYRLAYDDGVVTEKQYSKAMETFCEHYPKSADIWETMIRLSLENNNYKSARAYCNQAVRAGATDDAIIALKDQADYSFRVSAKTYTEIVQSIDGYTAVCNGKNWGIIGPDGAWIDKCDYQYAGPTGEKAPRLLTNSRDTRVLNDKDVVQSIVSVEIPACRRISDGLIPARDRNGWKFYDYENNKFVFDRFEDVTSFSDGRAFVKKGGKWYAMHTDGTFEDGLVYEDVAMAAGGEYVSGKLMVVKRGGVYELCGTDGKEISDLDAVQMDACRGGPVAFMDAGGKWGFADQKGKIVIEPCYDEARSFSGGLAAVRVEDRWGFINEEGRLVIDRTFIDVGYFSPKGVCFVSENEGEFHMITLRFGG